MLILEGLNNLWVFGWGYEEAEDRGDRLGRYIKNN
jgi:hypothetical protein